MLPKAIGERILVIGPEFVNHRGGVGEVLQSYSLGFEKFNFLPTYKYHKSNFSKAIYFIRQLIKFISILLRDRKIKIVHIHTSDYGSFFRKSIFVLVTKCSGRLAILHFHAAEMHLFYKRSALFRRYLRFIVGQTRKIICLSPQWKEFFLGVTDIDRIEVINNPVFPAKYVRKQQSVGNLRILFLGRIGQRKGIFDLIKAIAHLDDAHRRRIHLTVGGDGDVDSLKAAVSEYSFEQIISYRGWVTGKEKHDLLSSSDVFVLPSYNEGLPISILEAMTYGLPIVATPVGGIPEIVKDGVNGYLNAAGDVASLAKSLEKCLVEHEVVKSFGKRSIDLVAPYLQDNVMAKLNELYTKLLEDQIKSKPELK